MPIPTSDDSLELVEAQARALVAEWQTAEPWNSDKIKTAEILLKRLRRGAEPHSDPGPFSSDYTVPSASS